MFFTCKLEQVQQPDIDAGQVVTVVEASCADGQGTEDTASNTTAVTLPRVSGLALGETDRAENSGDVHDREDTAGCGHCACGLVFSPRWWFVILALRLPSILVCLAGGF